jgi:hypothetical protein
VLSLQVSSIIHNLRNMAMDMNAELESQNDQIDRITLKVNAGWAMYG